MPLPAEQQAIADELAALYREAQDRLSAELAAAVFDEARVSQVARLRSMIATVHSLRTQLEDASRTWMETRLPELHAAGATAAASATGSSFAWTAPHVDAVQALAETQWSTVAANLRAMEATTVRELRALARDAGREVIVEGRTAVQAGRDLASWMVDRGIFTVTYANGAEHLAADYAETVSRTVTAKAANVGTFTQSREDGFEWLEVIDGAACGWTSHDDPDLADGTIRSIDDCEANDLSHPNCARSFSPRPDITSQAEADAGGPDAEVQQAAAVAERARAQSATTTLSGHAPRSVRAAKVARVGR